MSETAKHKFAGDNPDWCSAMLEAGEGPTGWPKFIYCEEPEDNEEVHVVDQEKAGWQADERPYNPERSEVYHYIRNGVSLCGEVRYAGPLDPAPEGSIHDCTKCTDALLRERQHTSEQ